MTTQQATSSDYVFVPSTAAVTTSSELYIAYVLMQGMTSYTHQLVNMFQAQQSFAESSAEDMIKAGLEQKEEALMQGLGEMFSGGASIAGALSTSSFEEMETPNETPKQPGMTEEPNSTEMQDMSDSALQTRREELEAVQQRNQEHAENNKKIEVQNNKQMQLANGIGLAGKGLFDLDVGIHKQHEAKFQAAKTLADTGQQNAKGMIDQFMQLYNSSMSSLNAIYQTIAQIAQANTMR